MSMWDLDADTATPQVGLGHRHHAVPSWADSGKAPEAAARVHASSHASSHAGACSGHCTPLKQVLTHNLYNHVGVVCGAGGACVCVSACV